MTDTVRKFRAEQSAQPLRYRGASEGWTYVDKAGHAHRYDDRYEPLTGSCYPTLLVRSEHVPCDDPDCGCDGYDREWYICHLCGEIIRPATTEKVAYVAGRAAYFVDDTPVCEQDYRRQLAEFLATICQPETSGR